MTWKIFFFQFPEQYILVLTKMSIHRQTGPGKEQEGTVVAPVRGLS